VDMRLRPSGRQGPVATSLSAFQEYQRKEAWTWEHLALTRARVLAGNHTVGRAVETVRQEILGMPRDLVQIKKDVADMRARLAQVATSDPWDAKRGAGRMQDIELLGQAAALLSESKGRAMSDQLSAACSLGWLTRNEADEMLQIYASLWTLQAAGRLLGGRGLDVGQLGEGARGFLLDQMGAKSFETLQRDLAENAAKATQYVVRCLAAPDVAR